jgi:hypothetical protein
MLPHLSLWFWQPNRNLQFGITAQLAAIIFHMYKIVQVAGKLNLQLRQRAALSLDSHSTKYF